MLGPDGELQAMRYRGRGTVGAAALVLSGVRRENTMHAGQFAVSANGVLVYAPGNNDAHGELVAARSDGTAERLLAEPAPVVRWDVTPDGRMLAAVQELAAGDQLRITDRRAGREWTWLTAYHVGDPRWLPDGRLRVSVGREFGSEFSFDGIPLMEGDPVGATVVDTVVRSAPWTWESLSHDSVLVTAMGPNGFLGLMRLDGDAVSIDTLWVGPSWAATRSPDRRWIAHTTVRDNQYDVLLTSTAKGGVTHRVSSKGGLEPLWLTSSELVYRNDRTWYRVRIGSGRNDVVGRAETWFTDPAFLDTPGRSNSLLADGRLVYLRSTASSTTTLLRIIPRFRQSALRALRQR